MPELQACTQCSMTMHPVHTQVEFCLQWASRILDATPPLRERKPAGLCIMKAGAGMINSDDYLSPASKHVQRRAEHELVDMGKVALELKELNRQGGTRGPPKKAVRVSSLKVVCGYSQCAIEKPTRPQFKCLSCRDGGGAYYHIPCFFCCHRCVTE